MTKIYAAFIFVNMNKNTIRQKRLNARLSQEELARRCDISRQFLGMIELNKSVPTIHIAARIARELDCDVYDLWPRASE